MTTVAHQRPEALSPADAAPALELVDELWMAEGMDDGASDAERIIVAAGAVESLEWELDRARSTLAEAVERAASNGSSVELIAESAGMTREDVATLLWAARSDRSEA